MEDPEEIAKKLIDACEMDLKRVSIMIEEAIKMRSCTYPKCICPEKKHCQNKKNYACDKIK